METIKKYLKEIIEDENQIKDFLEINETKIKSFFTELWEEHLCNPVETTPQPETIDIRQTETAQPETSNEPLSAGAETVLQGCKPLSARVLQDCKPVSDIQEDATQKQSVENQEMENQEMENQEEVPQQQEEQKDMPKFGEANPPDKEQAKQDALAFQIRNRQIIMPNGKKGKMYSAPFNIETIGLPEIEAFYFERFPEGLTYSKEENAITGTPVEAGDYKILLNCVSNGGRKATKEILLIINPDPRELWSKNIPSPQGTPEFPDYNKPDSAKEFYKVESKKSKGVFGFGKKEIARKDMVAASQRGRSHAIEGKPRDDDFALYFDEQTEWYLMVVADGAGSAKFSRKGSQIACQTVKEVCSQQLTKGGISEVLELAVAEYSKDKSDKTRTDLYKLLHSEVLAKAAWTAKTDIEKEAENNNRVPKEYATTLLASICKKFDFGWFVGAFWVGDGGIGIYRKESQELKILGEPDGGEFAGQTRFLTMPEVFSDRARIRFEIVEDFTALILMSDGVTDPKFETDANLNRIEKWNELWDDLNGNNEDNAKVDFTDDNEQSADQLLKWLDFWSKGNHDDRTITILF